MTGAAPSQVESPSGREVSIFLHDRTIVGHWTVEGDILTLSALGETTASRLGALKNHPETLARLLLVKAVQGRRPRDLRPNGEPEVGEADAAGDPSVP